MPDYPGFIGPTGFSRSDSMSCERTINMYVQSLPNDPKTLMLYSMPGLQVVTELPSGPVRGLWEATNGRVFAVTSTTLFELFAGWTFLNRGSVPNGTNLVSMVDNGTHLVMSVEGTGLAYNFATNVLTTIVPEDPALTFGRLAFIDAYVLSNQPDTRRFWVSNLNDALTWGALSYYDAQARPDNLTAILTDHREIWAPGTQSIEVWSPTGRPINDLQGIGPFARMQGVMIEQGIASPWSLQALDNTVMFLGGTPRGDGPVWEMQGYTPRRISTHALESSMSLMSTVGDAVGFVARHGGHSFYGIDFPSGGETWLYDRGTQSWTELARLEEDGSLGPWLTHQHCMAFGVHAFGSRDDGKIMVWNPGFHYYGDKERYCARTGPFLRDEDGGKKITFASFQLRCLTGQGLDGDPPIGKDPHYRLSWTEDGERFSYEHVRTAGPIGDSERRVTWRQLGQSRSRAFRVSSTDPVLHAWRGAAVNI